MTTEEKGALLRSLDYIVNRLKEPSSWAGIALFIGFFGLSENTVERIVSNGPALITAVGALIAIFAPTKGRQALVEAREAKLLAQVASVDCGDPAAPTPADRI